MEIPKHYVIETYHRLGFVLRSVPDDPHSLVFDDGQGMMLFHPLLEGDLMELQFVLMDIQSTEGIMGMEAGWANDTWLPTLAQVLKGTEFELDEDGSPED